MNLRKLAALTVGATSLLTASSALAYEPAQVHEGASIGALVGFGENSFLFDTGIRGGYTLPAHVYLGGTFLLNVGTSGYCGFYGAGATYYCYGANTVGFTTGFEGGYDFAAGPLVVRAYGGLGVAFESISYNNYGACAGGVCGGTGVGPVCTQFAPNGACIGYGNPNTSSVALWGGGTAIYDFKSHGPWFVMGDVRIGDAPFLLANQFMGMFTVGGGYEF